VPNRVIPLPNHVFPGLDPGIPTNDGICWIPVKPADDKARHPGRAETAAERSNARKGCDNMPWAMLEDTKTKAKKLLGPSADIPKEKVDFDKLTKDIMDAYGKLDKIRSDLEAAVLDCETALSAGTNALKQTAAIYEKEDFGLDLKKKDDLKKITQARQLFSTVLKFGMTNLTSQSKDLDELDKHAIQLSKYKSPKSPMK
jgi:hypothetical protein